MTRIRAVILLGLLTLTQLNARWSYTRADAAGALTDASPLARCIAVRESGGDPNAIGSLGEQGLVQLYPYGGEMPRFYAAGYTDPFSPWQSLAFLESELQSGHGPAWSTYWECA